jgi:RNA polymerase sigma-70 factor, ECF subfamily
MIAHLDANYLHAPIRHWDDSDRSPGGNQSEGSLIAAIASGDQQAMRRLYERHSLRAYRFARRLGADHSAAEDLVNEVFLDVWRCASAFECRAQVSTWLLAILRNKALGISRKRSLEPLDESVSASIEDETDSPEVGIQKKQAASVLLQALRVLSPAHRGIIDLVYYHEKSIDEIARILNVPRSTVKTRMFYARKGWRSSWVDPARMRSAARILHTGFENRSVSPKQLSLVGESNTNSIISKMTLQ